MVLSEGIDSFERIIQKRYYHVDKTIMIKEILYHHKKDVILITRPRRFGKSLNLSMLECFLNIERKDEGTTLFGGLRIMDDKEVCEQWMHRYPVIHVSFKDVVGCMENDNSSRVDSAVSRLKGVIGDIALKHRFLLRSDHLNEDDMIAYKQISTLSTSASGTRFDMGYDALVNGLKTLSSLLQKHYGMPVVMLIDEYDTPLNEASRLGYYDEFVNTYMSLLRVALEGNDALALAVLTGCLKLSVFTDLNNLQVYDVTDQGLDDCYGFKDEEVSAMLDYFGLSQYHEPVKRFYSGYRFASQLVYNPWDVIVSLTSFYL